MINITLKDNSVIKLSNIYDTKIKEICVKHVTRIEITGTDSILFKNASEYEGDESLARQFFVILYDMHSKLNTNDKYG